MPPTHSTADRYLVLLHPDKSIEGAKQLAEFTQISVAKQAGRRSRYGKSATLRQHCAIIFDRIGVALVRCTPEKQALLADLAAAKDNAILAVEAERTVYATMTRQRIPTPAGTTPAPGFDERALTWGLQAVRADKSRYTGKGIRIAVLDTGLDLQHPDFAGRPIASRSFIDGETVQDGNGHGTHCVGIAGGPASPAQLPRYGVASAVELYIGKVLSNGGSGGDGGVLEGINWAIENQCQIISMSLGSPTRPEQSYSKIFEEVARRALTAGTIIVAAAGNDSHRPNDIAPVSHPANCPSIMAVAAIDSAMRVASFSSGGLHADGGEVNIAAPGVNVLSSWPAPEHYNTISGTSMATPFVAGVAALYAEADAGNRSNALLAILARQAAPLPFPERDVGAGVVQAP